MLKVAVITPYLAESLDLLRQCHDSVLDQTHACLHVMVADGQPRSELGGWNIDHVVLPRPHHDIGSTPRLVGCYHAIGLGYDAVAFLDADNWYRPDHIAKLASLCEATGAGFLSSGRMLCRPDGSQMGICPFTDADRFVDTSCMMFTRSGFHVLAKWSLMPDYAHVIGDRVMLHYVKEAGLLRAHSPDPSVYYRCTKQGVYERLGEPIPPGVREPVDYASGMSRWIAAGHPPIE
jgi:glycosyltransferase involved in cell wall biosynthesis